MAASRNLLTHLRSGAWLSSRSVRLSVVIMLTFEIAIFVFMIAGTHGWIIPIDRPTTTDFVSFYAAGRLADAGTPALAYDHSAHLAAEETVTGPGIEYQFFNYPPIYEALFAPFAYLPYLVAFVLFEATTLLFYLVIARRVLGDYSGTALLALIAFPAVWWNIGLGQNAFLTAGLFGAATLVIDRRPVLAGILFGALCYKPHFALLVPLALAAGGRWSAFAAAATSAITLVLLSLALFGSDTWHAYLAAFGASHSIYESGRILFGGFTSPFGAVRLLGGSITFAYVIQGVFSFVAATTVAAVWRRGLSLPTRAAVLASATLIAVPLALIYDLMLATIAACWLLSERGGGTADGWMRALFAGLFVMLLNWRYFAETWNWPVVSLTAVALFLSAAHRAWREWTIGSISLTDIEEYRVS
jgi:alpha-1,2-mannosyltransferase